MYTFDLHKMKTELGSPVRYKLIAGEAPIDLNTLIGHRLSMRHTGEIHCIACGRRTNKSFSQGYCYPCFRKLPECDSCIVSPEKCHFDQGTCRDEDWGRQHCMQPHIIYLSNTSGVKIGITRQSQIPTRWIDQGAVQALPILRVKSRFQSGLLEVAFKQHVADKTNWRRMLKNDTEELDLAAMRDRLLELCDDEISQSQQRFGEDSVEFLDHEVVMLDYPVEHYPEKVTSLNLDKSPEIQGRLEGIKGQYLLLDGGVINIRRHGGYQVELEVDA